LGVIVTISPPTNLLTFIDENDSTVVGCFWEDNTNFELAYEVQWATNSSAEEDFTRVGLLPPDSTRFLFKPEFPLLTNVFRVRAIGPDSIPSAWSNLNIAIPYPFAVGLEDELEKKRLKTFPNPTSDKIILTTEELGEMKVYLFNMQGKELYSTSFEKSTEIDLSNYPSGIYFLKYEVDEKQGFRKVLRE